MGKIRFIVVIVILCISNITHSQISFELDSLKISHVTWICQSNVVITHFAYGPHLRMVFSMKNNGVDTIIVGVRDLHVCINSQAFEGGECKETFLELHTDSLLVIPPNTKVKIRGSNDLVETGEVIEDLNYRMTTFMPFITQMLKDATFILTISGHQVYTAPIRNCYIGSPFFVDGTFNESIFSPNH